MTCGNCDYVTFHRYELQDHFAQLDHQEPGLLQRATRISIDLTLGLPLVTGGAILLGAILAAMIFSAKVLVLLVIPALLILTWWFRRDRTMFIYPLHLIATLNRRCDRCNTARGILKCHMFRGIRILRNNHHFLGRTYLVVFQSYRHRDDPTGTRRYIYSSCDRSSTTRCWTW